MTTLLVERIVDIIEMLRTQMEGSHGPIETANMRGRISGLRAILKIIEDMEKAQQ